MWTNLCYLLPMGKEGRENIRTNCIAWGIALWPGEGFIAVSSWEGKMTAPIIDLDEEMAEVIPKKKKRNESQDIFYMVQNFAKTWPKKMTVTCHTFSNWIAYTLGKTLSLVWFASKIIFLATGCFLLLILVHCTAIYFY